MIQRRVLIVYAAMAVLLLTSRVEAQVADDIRDRVNRGRVSIITGNVAEYADDSANVSLGVDLARVLNEEGEFRVVSVIGSGPVATVEDILYQQGIDMGFVKADILTYLDRRNRLRIAQNKIRYIAKVYDETFHILARREISGIEELAGKPVSAGLREGDSYVSAETVFDIVDVRPKWVHFDWQTALAKVTSGELAAIVVVAPKPSRLLLQVADRSELHFLPLPASVELLNTYEVAQLTSVDYPKLVPEDRPVETLKVGVLLGVYNWRPTQQRYNKLSRFVAKFFDNFEELYWKQVDLENNVPGWARFGPAQARVSARIAGRQAERR